MDNTRLFAKTLPGRDQPLGNAGGEMAGADQHRHGLVVAWPGIVTDLTNPVKSTIPARLAAPRSGAGRPQRWPWSPSRTVAENGWPRLCGIGSLRDCGS